MLIIAIVIKYSKVHLKRGLKRLCGAETREPRQLIVDNDNRIEQNYGSALHLAFYTNRNDI